MASDRRTRERPWSDERTVESKYRVAGFLGPRSSSFTLAWLAGHRERLRTMIVGGRRLSVLVLWDRRGPEEVAWSDADVEALRQIVYGAVSDQGEERP